MKLIPLSYALILALPGLAPAQSIAPHDSERARTLDQLIVSASPLRSSSEEVIQPVEILAGTALDDRRALNLGDTVSQLLGVQSSFFGAGVGRPIIRGQEGPRVQVLSEGLASLDASTASADHAVSIEPFLADQIEVLKGPATLLYGAGAIGGAVNVVDGRIPTELPSEPLSGRAEIRLGSVADERTGMGRLDGKSGSWAWHVDGFRRQLSDYDIPGYAHLEDSEEPADSEEEAFGVLPNSAVDTRGGAAGASFIGERGYLGYSLSRFETVYGIPGHAHHAHEEEDAPLSEPGESQDEEAVMIDLRQTRHDVKAGMDAPLDGIESINFRFGINNYRHVELEGDEVGTRFQNAAYEGRADLVHAPLAGWRGALGLQLSRRDFRAEGEEAFVPASVTRDLGLFLIEERDTERWKFELGARADRVEIDVEQRAAQTFSGFSASAGALFRLSSALHFSASFDHAQRAPTAEELFSDGAHAATRSYEVGDEQLRRETARQIELAAHLHAGRLSGKLAAFDNRFDDFIYLADSREEVEGLPLRNWSQADARFRGLEAELKLELADGASGRWSMRASGDRVDAALRSGQHLPRIAPARLGLGLEWSLDGMRAGIDAQRYQRQADVGPFEQASAGFTLLNARLAYHWDIGRAGWEFYLQGSNLGDREARLHTSLLKNEAPLPGRNLQIGLRSFF